MWVPCRLPHIKGATAHNEGIPSHDLIQHDAGKATELPSKRPTAKLRPPGHFRSPRLQRSTDALMSYLTRDASGSSDDSSFPAKSQATGHRPQTTKPQAASTASIDGLTAFRQWPDDKMGQASAARGPPQHRTRQSIDPVRIGGTIAAAALLYWPSSQRHHPFPMSPGLGSRIGERSAIHHKQDRESHDEVSSWTGR